jgi:dihydroorotase
MTIIPRDIFGMEMREIKKGEAASLTLFTEAGNSTLAEANVVSASRNNPFIGEKLNGKVLGIINEHQVHLNK